MNRQNAGNAGMKSVTGKTVAVAVKEGRVVAVAENAEVVEAGDSRNYQIFKLY